MEVPKDFYEKMEKSIQSDSPVGIDAKKTHIMILYKLSEIEKKIRNIENRLENKDA